MSDRVAAKITPDYAVGADFLRVAAVFLIGWFHIWQQSWLDPGFTVFGHHVNLLTTVRYGYVFVDVMLMLSGFCLMLGHLSGRNRDVKSFYRARVARIVPCYYLCLFVMLFGFVIPNGEYANAGAMWRDLLPHLTFTHSLSYASYIGTKLNGALWTLSVEVQFYLIFPFIARIFEKKPVITFSAMVALGQIAHLLTMGLFSDTTLYFNQLPNMLDVYAVGMMGAVIYRRLAQREVKLRGRIIATVLGIAAAVGMVWVMKLYTQSLGQNGYESVRRSQLMARLPICLMGAAFVITTSLSLKGLRYIVSNPVIRFLSGISFNFYMWHQFLAVKLKQWRIPPYTGDAPNMENQSPWQNRYTILCFVIACALATVLTYAVERPCARKIKNFRIERKSKMC